MGSITVGTSSGPQSTSVTLLHWAPALSLKKMLALVCFWFICFFSWGSIDKKKKGSRAGVEVAVLSKDNLTVD